MNWVDIFKFVWWKVRWVLVASIIGAYVFGALWVSSSNNPQVDEKLYCDVPPMTCPEDSVCNKQLIECDAAYTVWKARAEECRVKMAELWNNLPNYSDDQPQESPKPGD